jgi:quinol monooxygenase YgiN
VFTVGVTEPNDTPTDEPLGALLPGRVGLFVRLVCRPGARTAALDITNRYMDDLASEPGTEAFVVAVDPTEADILWFYEWFTDEPALDAHRASPAFHAMMAAMPGVLAAPPALIRVDPLRMHLQRSVAEGHTVDRIF